MPPRAARARPGRSLSAADEGPSLDAEAQRQEEMLKKIQDAQGAPERCRALINNLGKVIGGLQKRRHDTGVAVDRDRAEVAAIERQQAMFQARLTPLLANLEAKEEAYKTLSAEFEGLKAQTQGLIGKVSSDRRRANREAMARARLTIPVNPHTEAFNKSKARTLREELRTSTSVRKTSATAGVRKGLPPVSPVRRPSGQDGK